MRGLSEVRFKGVIDRLDGGMVVGGCKGRID
jgi:hypothetical protein